MTEFTSINPATQEIVWKGSEATSADITTAIQRAEQAFTKWMDTPFAVRAAICERFGALLDDTFAELISKEMGKPLWDSKLEVEAMKRKVDVSIRAFNERTPSEAVRQNAITRPKPHGVVAVFGPFNFPGHLPTGHIIPLLIAGNVILFKPSELTPAVGEYIGNLWKQANLPEHVLQVIQGGKTVGELLVNEPGIRGIFFTGSAPVGKAILDKSLQFPKRIVALEMGGNNPLIISSYSDLQAAVFTTIQSAFITSGQRCSAARRLILIESEKTAGFVDALIEATKKLVVGPYTQTPEPYLGPVATATAAQKIWSQYQVITNRGGAPLLALQQPKGAFVSPAIIDVTSTKVEDDEIFGPILQLYRVKDIEQAITYANQTNYGLTAGILTTNRNEYLKVLKEVQAGVINWNTPLTGASSWAPFGGLGKSGNFRPSAYYAADYASYPVASLEIEKVVLPASLPPGFPQLTKESGGNG